jgi:hypothetical protein
LVSRPETVASGNKGSNMTHDAKTLQHIMDYCDRKWAEANEAPASDFPTPDMLTGKKMAYNDVLQYARTLLDELP